MGTVNEKIKFKPSNIAMLFTHGLNEVVSIFVIFTVSCAKIVAQLKMAIAKKVRIFFM